jgi:hypothetical protein
MTAVAEESIMDRTSISNKALVLCLEQMKNNQKLRSEDLDAVSTM